MWSLFCLCHACNKSAIAFCHRCQNMETLDKDKHTLLKSSASLPPWNKFYTLISRLKFTCCLSYQRPHFLSSRTRVVAPKVPSGAAAHLGGRLLNRSANSTPVHLGALNTWLGPCEAFVRVQGEDMGVRKPLPRPDWPVLSPTSTVVQPTNEKRAIHPLLPKSVFDHRGGNTSPVNVTSPV